MTQELARALRNFGPALVAYAVGKGYIPHEFSGPLTEVIAILVAGGTSFAFSKRRDAKRQ